MTAKEYIVILNEVKHPACFDFDIHTVLELEQK